VTLKGKEKIAACSLLVELEEKGKDSVGPVEGLPDERRRGSSWTRKK